MRRLSHAIKSLKPRTRRHLGWLVCLMLSRHHVDTRYLPRAALRGCGHAGVESGRGCREGVVLRNVQGYTGHWERGLDVRDELNPLVLPLSSCARGSLGMASGRPRLAPTDRLVRVRSALHTRSPISLASPFGMRDGKAQGVGESGRKKQRCFNVASSSMPSPLFLARYLAGLGKAAIVRRSVSDPTRAPPAPAVRSQRPNVSFGPGVHLSIHWGGRCAWPASDDSDKAGDATRVPTWVAATDLARLLAFRPGGGEKMTESMSLTPRRGRLSGPIEFPRSSQSGA